METETETERQIERDARRESLFDWPVAFTKVRLLVSNCTLAKCSEKQSHVYLEIVTVYQ